MDNTVITLTFVTTCKGRLDHLKQTLPLMVAAENTSCVVVDYGCPLQSGVWVQQNFPQVHVEFVTDDAEFCLARARNFGVRTVTSPWVCFIDADIRIQAGFAAWLNEPRKPSGIYRAPPLAMTTWGTMLCRTDAFRAVGGYDEVIRGWGGEDDDLYLRMREAGGVDAEIPPELLDPIEHDDHVRTAFYPLKDRFLQHRINYLYTHLKADIGRHSPQYLTLDGRRQIMAEAARTVINAAAQNATAHFEVELPTVEIPQIRKWRISRKIVYDAVEIRDPVQAPTARPVTSDDSQISVANGLGLQLNLTVIPGEATQALASEIFLDKCYAAPPQTQLPTTIVDIGAGVGLTAAYFRLIYPQASIYCFESDAAALAILHKNVAIIGNAEVNPQESTSRVTGSATALDALAFLPQIDILKLASAASNLPILSSMRPRLADIATIYVEFSSVATRDRTTTLLGEALKRSHVLWKAQALGKDREVRGVLIYTKQSAVAATDEK